MKKKSPFKKMSSLDKTIEANAEKKSAWKKIILELEKAQNKRKDSKNN